MVCKIICPILKPKKELKTVYLFDIHEKEIENIDLYLNNIPETDLKFINKITLKRNHFIKPLFGLLLSVKCAGCGEITHIKLLTQLFDDRLIIVNEAVCFSIYVGITIPYTKKSKRRKISPKIKYLKKISEN